MEIECRLGVTGGKNVRIGTLLIVYIIIIWVLL